MRERMQKERNEKNRKEASRGIHYIPWREAFLCRAFIRQQPLYPSISLILTFAAVAKHHEKFLIHIRPVLKHL